VLLTFDGIPDFDALHSRRHDEQVQLYAFDILALDGEDLHELPLSMRKTPLELSRKVQCTGGNSNILSSALGELHYVAETCTRRTHKLTAIEHFVAPLDVLHFAQESASARAGTLAAQERPSGPHDLSLQEP
jgi:hypothetical protein